MKDVISQLVAIRRNRRRKWAAACGNNWSIKARFWKFVRRFLFSNCCETVAVCNSQRCDDNRWSEARWAKQEWMSCMHNTHTHTHGASSPKTLPRHTEKNRKRGKQQKSNLFQHLLQFGTITGSASPSPPFNSDTNNKHRNEVIHVQRIMWLAKK